MELEIRTGRDGKGLSYLGDLRGSTSASDGLVRFSLWDLKVAWVTLGGEI